MYVCMYVCMHACMHTYIHTYIHTYTYTCIITYTYNIDMHLSLSLSIYIYNIYVTSWRIPYSPASRRGRNKRGLHRRATNTYIWPKFGFSAHMWPHLLQHVVHIFPLPYVTIKTIKMVR